MNDLQHIVVNARKPKSMYYKRAPEWFVGRQVIATCPSDDGDPERLGVAVTGVEGHCLVGAASDFPLEDLDLKETSNFRVGQRVVMAREQVLSVSLSEAEWDTHQQQRPVRVIQPQPATPPASPAGASDVEWVWYNGQQLAASQAAKVLAAQGQTTSEVAYGFCERTQYGEKKREKVRCPYCSAAPGQFHVLNCILERCARCGEDAYGCSCLSADECYGDDDTNEGDENEPEENEELVPGV